jgi:putative SOS response-associated peptidase YedK
VCGRFTNRLTWREIVALYHLSVPAQPERNLPGRYNICPTDPIDAVVERHGKRDPCADAVGTSAVVVEEEGQGDACHFQRSRRYGGRHTDVS